MKDRISKKAAPVIPGRHVRARLTRAANEAALFHPYTVAEDGTEGLPAVEVAGVLVFAYVKDGELRVSVDLDTARHPDGPFMIIPGHEDEVPMVITVQGVPVFSAVRRP